MKPRERVVGHEAAGGNGPSYRPRPWRSRIARGPLAAAMAINARRRYVVAEPDAGIVKIDENREILIIALRQLLISLHVTNGEAGARDKRRRRHVASRSSI